MKKLLESLKPTLHSTSFVSEKNSCVIDQTNIRSNSSGILGLVGWVWSQDVIFLISITCDKLPYIAKETFQMWLDLRILRWRDDPGLSRWANVITWVIVRRKQEGQSQREKWEYATFLALKMKDKTMSQGTLAARRSWTRQGKGFSLSNSRRDAALPTL